jgi:two-component system, sensor histidine kinase
MERILARAEDAPYSRLTWLWVTFCYVAATNAMTMALADGDPRFRALWGSNAGFLAALLLAPRRHRAALCLVAFAGFLVSGLALGHGPAGIVVLSACHVIEVVVACTLIELGPGHRVDLTRLRGLSQFLVACFGPAPMVSCVLWFSWLTANGHPIPLQRALQWQVSHGLGLIILVPVILVSYSRIVLGHNVRRAEVAEALVHALGLLVVSAVVFAQPLAVLYLILPLICLAAFRSGFLGAGLSVVVVATVATLFTEHGLGPIYQTAQDPNVRILLIQLFVASCVLTALPICVVLTDRNRLNLSLSASERRFRELAEAAPIGILLIAPDHRITYANRELAVISGRSIDVLQTERIGQLLDDETRQKIDAALDACHAGCTGCSLAEVSFSQVRDGRMRWFQLHFAAMLDDERQGGWIGTVMDVTELRVARDRAMSAVEARTRFLAVMSHEVRTPMTGVLATFELLARQSAAIAWPIPDMPRLIASTQAQARGLMTILTNVLDQAKLENGRLDMEAIAFAPAVVLGDAVEIYHDQAAAKGIALTYDGKGPEQVVGDSGRLFQAVSNLLSNALKFTQNGAVDVTCEDIGDGTYRIAVTDTGIGIPPEATAAIVEPFAQAERSTNRRFGGTGLGLSIVRDLAEAMGGRLEIASTVGVGSRFSLVLPTASGVTLAAASDGPTTPAAADRPDAGQAANDLAGLRVLVVDDTDATRLAAQAQLHMIGCRAQGASGGLEAIAAALDGAFDLLLVDSAMPGLDGAGTIALLRLLPGPRGDVPILGFTAYSQGELQQDLLDAGAWGVIVKPFAAQDMQAAIRVAIAERADRARADTGLDAILAGFTPDMHADLLASLARDLERLGQASAEADRARALHALRGVAGAFGFDELERMCRFVETCPADPAIAPLADRDFRACLERAIDAVAQRQKTTPTSANGPGDEHESSRKCSSLPMTQGGISHA